MEKYTIKTYHIEIPPTTYWLENGVRDKDEYDMWGINYNNIDDCINCYKEYIRKCLDRKHLGSCERWYQEGLEYKDFLENGKVKIIETIKNIKIEKNTITLGGN